MLLGGLVNLVVSFATGGLGAAVWTREAVWSVIYLIVAGSWIGFTAFVWLLHHVPTSKVSTHSYVNPIVAVVLGWLILHEQITGYIIAGSVIVVASVVLVTGARHKVPAAVVEADLALELEAAEAAAITGKQEFADKAGIKDKAFLGEQA